MKVPEARRFGENGKYRWATVVSARVLAADRGEGIIVGMVGQARIHPGRCRWLNESAAKSGPIVCWLSRDLRAEDNWAVLAAQASADREGVAMAVVFCLMPTFLDASKRHYEFMLAGLEEMERDCDTLRIPFFVLMGSAEKTLPKFLKQIDAGGVVCDFSPLRGHRSMCAAVAESAKRLSIPMMQVDAHNIVPAWMASTKQEFGAYTIRPKILARLPEFLEPFAKVHRQERAWPGTSPKNDWRAIRRSVKASDFGPAITWIRSGRRAAEKQLEAFVENGLTKYDSQSNDPNAGGQSQLSPYLHFGQLSAQRVALRVSACKPRTPGHEAFLEQLIVRRELSENFCLYNEAYDRVDGFPEWAKKTIAAHRMNRREYLYSMEQFESATTHDALWNAAQRQMVASGKMHGYLRMYWAKKILEWTASAEQAMTVALTLNDRYSLDGRDPNGVVGVAWSIGGVHDRAWVDRPVFGKIRYMNLAGCKRKFDVAAYVAKWGPIPI